MKKSNSRSASAALIILVLIVIVAVVAAGFILMSGSTPTTSSAACHIDFKVTTTQHIGEYYSSLGVYQNEAGAGMKYAIYEITVVNGADKSLSLNAYFWESVISGVTYQHSVATYDSSIGYQSVDVGKGGTFTTKIVFEVPSSSSLFSLRYTGLDPPRIIWD